MCGMLKVSLCVFWLVVSDGFLFPNYTSKTNTTGQFVGVHAQQVQQQNLLEQSVLQLQNDVQALQQKCAGVASEETDTIAHLKDVYLAMKERISLLEEEQKQTRVQNLLLNQANTQLQSQIKFYADSTIIKLTEAINKITEINQTVVLTSCSIHGPVQAGTLVKFPQIKTVYGIQNIEGFKNLGTFTCEIPGVYLFSVFILNSAYDGQFGLYKNNETIAVVETSHVSIKTFTTFHTGTGVVAVILNTNDTLSVKAYFADIYVMSGHSCMTIIKIR